MYVPDITSYDYDAPMTEAGDPTPKYMDIRRTIGKVFLSNPNINQLFNEIFHVFLI